MDDMEISFGQGGDDGNGDGDVPATNSTLLVLAVLLLAALGSFIITRRRLA
jgi:LPXTG-motif cell wall-anchored protein